MPDTMSDRSAQLAVDTSAESAAIRSMARFDFAAMYTIAAVTFCRHSALFIKACASTYKPHIRIWMIT